MAKTFFVRRTPEGTEVTAKTLAHAWQLLQKTEKRYGKNGPKTLQLCLMLAAMYWIVRDLEKAEPLLKRYIEAAEKNRTQNSFAFFWARSLLSKAYSEMNRYSDAAMVVGGAKSLSWKLDPSDPDPIFQALEHEAFSFDRDGNVESRQQGLAVALMALCWCITSGLHRTPWGAQELDGLRLHFSTYGIVLDEWRWLVKHAHLTNYDFIGLLSIVLHNADTSPVSVKSWMKREPRVIEVR